MSNTEVIKPRKIKAVKPIGTRILVRRLEKSSQTAGGIHLPDNHATREENNEAVVVELGTGKEDHTFSVAVGDRVMVSKYGGTDVTIDEVKHTIFEEIDLMGIITFEGDEHGQTE